MKVLKLISRNTVRHRLRTSLTILGMAIAVMAFCVIRTAIIAWYASAETAAPDRLIVRNAISLTFELPISYGDKILEIEGVNAVSHASWFGGVYIDPKNFFPRFAVDAESYLAIYPEYPIPEEQREAFLRDKNSAIAGIQLADRFGWEIGDIITLQGDIYPGTFEFVLRGIYTGAKENTDEGTMFFHFDYIDEVMRQTLPGRDGSVGTFVVRIDDPARAAEISETIDALFVNSLAETKTETEEAFTLGFVEFSGQIIQGLQVISIMVIGIILLVLGNTMAMTARERINEYAVMKTLGFRGPHIVGLILGESVVIAVLGGLLGLGLSWLVIPGMRAALSVFLPAFPLEPITLILGFAAALLVGILASVFPIIKALRTSIVDGLRIID